MNTKAFGKLDFTGILNELYGINGHNLCWGSDRLKTYLIKDVQMDEMEALELISCYYEV
jgi:hypothetical protein